MLNLPTKFEVPSLTRYGDMKGVKNAQNGFDFNRNYASILYRFRHTASSLSKFADFTLPHLHLAPPLGVTPFEFRKERGLFVDNTSRTSITWPNICSLATFF